MCRRSERIQLFERVRKIIGGDLYALIESLLWHGTNDALDPSVPCRSSMSCTKLKQSQSI